MQRDSKENAKRIAAERNEILKRQGKHDRRWYVTETGSLQIGAAGRPVSKLDLGDR